MTTCRKSHDADLVCINTILYYMIAYKPDCRLASDDWHVRLIGHTFIFAQPLPQQKCSHPGLIKCFRYLRPFMSGSLCAVPTAAADYYRRSVSLVLWGFVNGMCWFGN